MVLARQRARQIAALLGFDAQDQTRIATAVSEIARNAFSTRAAAGASSSSTPAAAASWSIRVSGPGPAALRAILDGRYRRRRRGWASASLGARRLMDRFEIEPRPAAATTRQHGQDSAAAPRRVPPGRRWRASPPSWPEARRATRS